MTRKKKTLTATNLKAELWSTLQGVKDGTIQPATGDVIATQAREILRTVKVQLAVFSQARQEVSKEVKSFAQDDASA